jgi:hypothetical protein
MEIQNFSKNRRGKPLLDIYFTKQEVKKNTGKFKRSRLKKESNYKWKFRN